MQDLRCVMNKQLNSFCSLCKSYSPVTQIVRMDKAQFDNTSHSELIPGQDIESIKHYRMSTRVIIEKQEWNNTKD